jgi:predicted TPR repeat methyltransferase
LLDYPGQRKAEALANFIEGARLEQNGEIEAALTAYQKVLTVDPAKSSSLHAWPRS